MNSIIEITESWKNKIKICEQKGLSVRLHWALFVFLLFIGLWLWVGMYI